MKCIVCNHEMRLGITSWHSECAKCGYERSSLAPSINVQMAHAGLDEALREEGLRALRRANFHDILSRLAEPAGARLLDVGCAYGWFLDEAKIHFNAVGIEPDDVVANFTEARGHKVKVGLFPDVLENNEIFDVIVFNDVFEHIPEAGECLRACYAHLKSGGTLVVNLPSADGFIYRVSKYLARFGLSGPFDRMWQKGLPSPHLHFFNPKTLNQLASQAGFRRVEAFHLPTFSIRGLWARLRCVKSTPLFTSVAYYVLILSIIPLLAILPKDAQVSIFSKQES